ncbi:MAG: MFS transporter [Clostridia bacterium]|nr:MFS transporter [Clostridia bacterium]
MRKTETWEKNTIFFLSSQTISLTGSMLVQYAITWYITLETQSGLMMTISIICGFLPTFFISPFAGVWADRYSRKKLIVLADILIAAATFVLAVLFIMGFESIWLLFVASAIRSVGAGIQTPSVGAFLPQIVPEEQLTRVNGINSSIQAFVTLIAPMVSGALMSLSSLHVIFFIDVVTAGIAVFIMLAFLHVPVHAKASEKQETSYVQDMRIGLGYINTNSFIKSIFLFCAIYFILISPLAFLTPLQVARSFGNDVWRLTLIEIAFSVGMMLGGIFIASWGGLKNRIHTIIAANVVISISTLALGLTTMFGLYIFLMVLIGFAIPVFNTPFVVLLQERVESDFLGRVFGVLSMISSSVMPLAMIVYGPLADMIKIEWLLIMTGILMLVQTALMLNNKVLLEAGKP